MVYNMEKFKVISFGEARKFAREENYIVVDLRSEEEYFDGHIENAINIPDADMDMIQSFGKGDYVWVLYCRRGSYSFKLASDMADSGYNVMAVAGGFKK